MKFKKKPVIIEAFRLGVDPIPDWFIDEVNRHNITCNYPHEYNIFADIATPEGVMRADYGDYIIKGVKSEIYPCKPDIFEMTYDKVEEE